MKKLISCSLSNDNTVDREYETDFILKIIQEKKTDLLILYAQSGVGKSTLCNRILKSIPDYIPICVRTNPENEDTLQPEGTYLERIFNCFVNYFYKNKKDFRRYSFDYYIAHNKNATIKREALESMFSSVSEKNPLLTFGISIGKYISSRLCKLYEYNTANKLHLSTKESMLIAHEYIKYILKNVGICLDIDNLQNIDKYSLQLLTEWISVSDRKSFFIFEYTIPEINNKSSIISFATYFQNINLNVELLQLNSLDVDDAILAIKKANIHNEDNIFFEKIKAFYIYHKDGNMQKLLDFSL